jgi:UDP-N-acetylglucosamine 2-epimerase (non-hydrolysing)
VNNMVLKVMTIMGTRPEAIKMAPVIKALANYPENVESIVCVTGQHREMLDQALETFRIVPDYDLNLMNPNQSLSLLTANILTALDKLIVSEKPDWILVQGDTTTVMVASLVAYYHRVKLGHVEAGLRSHDKFQPFPEEVNRRIADILADAYFAPTQNSRMNLLKEGIQPQSIVVTGNTVIDALMMIAKRVAGRPLDPRIGQLHNKSLILVTVHRRENLGKRLEDICKALARIALTYEHKIQIVFPVHLNPNVRTTVYAMLGAIPNIALIEPVNYEELVNIMSKAYLVMTDSGGIQEEAPSLNKPVLVLRDVTERPEVIDAGAAKLVGTDSERIYLETKNLIEDSSCYYKMSNTSNPYGDGRAGERIVQFLLGRSVSEIGNSPAQTG